MNPSERALVESRRDVLDHLPPVIELLARRPGMVCAYLFGSTLDEARETVRDIDLAILEQEPLSFQEIGSLCLELGRKFRTDALDIVDLRTARRELRQEIFAKGRLLVDVAPAESARLRERTLSEHLDHRHLRHLYHACLQRAFRRSYVRVAR